MTDTVEEDRWFTVLSEVRRQAKHVADAMGVESAVERDGRLFDRAEEAWQVVNVFDKVKQEGVWQEQQWQNAFEILFLQTPSRLEGGNEQDDLLFFVLKERTQATSSPLLVRRKGKSMPADLRQGAASSELVSWVDSVLLNLVLQTAFRLCASICRKEDLPAAIHSATEELPMGVTKVSGKVFASPSRVRVSGPSRQPGNEAMEVAYPDICFAVDESHSGFDSLELPEPGTVLLVTLIAEQGIALHAEHSGCPEAPKAATSRQHDASAPTEGFEVPLQPSWSERQSDNRHPSRAQLQSARGLPEPVSLLSGYVSFDQLEDLMQQNHASLRKEGGALDINMKGPGGQGHASVSAKWKHNDDGGHLLVGEPPARRQKISMAPKSGGILGRLLPPLGFLKGRQPSVGNPRICCTMKEVALPVSLLAPMILRVPLKATEDE